MDVFLGPDEEHNYRAVIAPGMIDRKVNAELINVITVVIEEILK